MMGDFFLRCMNVIQVKKPSGIKCNCLLYVLVEIMKYKKITVDHTIGTKLFSGGGGVLSHSIY